MVSGGGEICNLAMSSPGFPSGSAGKESACNEGDLGLIPGLGRSLGEGKGHPRQYSWVSLVAQLVNNLPAKKKKKKESACNAGNPDSIPGSGIFPGEGKGNPLQYSCLENSVDRGAWQAIVHGDHKESGMTE